MRTRERPFPRIATPGCKWPQMRNISRASAGKLRCASACENGVLVSKSDPGGSCKKCSFPKVHSATMASCCHSGRSKSWLPLTRMKVWLL